MQHYGPMAGQWLLAGVRKKFDDLRKHDKITEKEKDRDGRGPTLSGKSGINQLTS